MFPFFMILFFLYMIMIFVTITRDELWDGDLGYTEDFISDFILTFFHLFIIFPLYKTPKAVFFTSEYYMMLYRVVRKFNPLNIWRGLFK